jgi:hypothetical protein
MRRRFHSPPEAVRRMARLVFSEASSAARRGLDRALSRGMYARPLDLERDRVVLLFYQDMERDRLVRDDRHLQTAARRLYQAASMGRKASGFEVAFRLLVTALERAGHRVVINDRALAARNPRYPVGVAGYPHILERWSLPNPALLGPGLLDHPSLAPGLMSDDRFVAYLVPSEWTRAIFERGYPGKCQIWFAGIDLEAWPDTRSAKKDLDVLVYDKVTFWDPSWQARLVDPLLRALEARGRSFRVIRYGEYVHEDFKSLLRRSRALAFLSANETQGLAYQEALASNVPVLAWDNGTWLDSRSTQWEGGPVPASSVPYFADACGARFRGAAEIPVAVDAFFSRIDSFEPRRFVQETLSLEASAARYLTLYRAAAVAGRAPG